MLRAIITALFALAAFGAPDASAQIKYPTKPVELIVPFVAGASTDSCARVLAQGWKRAGSSSQVVNKPGGSACVDRQVMAARPDGTTMLVDNIARAPC
jgi:tripartite-type tricarboxylate transporter receptor subunit TctC